MNFTTDQAGTVTAIKITNPFGALSPIQNVMNKFINLNFVGSDTFSGGGTKYWNYAINLISVSNNDFRAINLNGGAPNQQGNGVWLQGVSNRYSVVSNFIDSTFSNCNTAITFGDWAQGLQVANGNFMNCTNGIITPSSAAGVLSEISVVNSQFGYNVRDIITNSSADDVHLANNLFLDETNNSGGAFISSAFYTVTGNTWVATAVPTLGYALTIANNSGTYCASANYFCTGTVSGNTFTNTLGGINISSGASPVVFGNTFTGIASNTITNGSTLAYIYDNPGGNYITPFASLPTCNTANEQVRLKALGASGLTWGATLTTGSTPYEVNCNGTNWTVEGK
jgi:parallel beta-helix repeat protein